MYAFAETLDFAGLLPVAVFGLVTTIMWWCMDFFAGQESRAIEQRLEEFRTHQRRGGSRESGASRTDMMSAVLAKAAPSLAKPLAPKTEAEQGKLKNRLSAAGFRSEHAGMIFLGLKFFGLISGTFIGLSVAMPTYGLTLKAFVIVLICALLMLYLPELMILFLGSRRKTAVFLGLPDALDLMVVCVEAGLALDQAMRRVAEEMKFTHAAIAEEFSIANFQLQMGRPRYEVLQELGARSGVQDLRTLAMVLIQADKFGTSVAQALRVQSDAMRLRRRQIAEEKAAKTAVKLIFPLVLFIFPGIFVILVGPAAIQMIRQMLPAMNVQ